MQVRVYCAITFFNTMHPSLAKKNLDWLPQHNNIEQNCGLVQYNLEQNRKAMKKTEPSIMLIHLWVKLQGGRLTICTWYVRTLKQMSGCLCKLPSVIPSMAQLQPQQGLPLALEAAQLQTRVQSLPSSSFLPLQMSNNKSITSWGQYYIFKLMRWAHQKLRNCYFRYLLLKIWSHNHK